MIANSSKPIKTALIIGGGHVGTYLSSRLSRGGTRVILKTNNPDESSPSTQICRADGVTLVNDLSAVFSDNTNNIDLCFVTTKTYDHEHVAKELESQWARPQNTILCHNGYMKDSAKTFNGPVFKALVSGGYSFTESGLAVKNGDKPWGIVGGDTAQNAQIVHKLSQRGLYVIGGHSARIADAKKFLVNSTANLLSVVANANCSQLTSNSVLLNRMRALFFESDVVLRAEPSHSELFKTPPAILCDDVLESIASYGTHYPSSHRDFNEGKILEIQALNGYVIELGNIHGLNVGTHKELVEEVNELVESNQRY